MSKNVYASPTIYESQTLYVQVNCYTGTLLVLLSCTVCLWGCVIIVRQEHCVYEWISCTSTSKVLLFFHGVYVRVCVCACMCACVRACVRVCARMYVCARADL